METGRLARIALGSRIITTSGQDGHGTRPKRPGFGVGPGGGAVEDRARCVYVGRIWGVPIGKNVRPSVNPSVLVKINCHVFGIDKLLFESGGENVFGIDALRKLGAVFGDTRASQSKKSVTSMWQ